MNKKSNQLTIEQYNNIIEVMIRGFCGSRPNKKIALVLMLIADTGEKLCNVLNLRFNNILFQEKTFVYFDDKKYEISKETEFFLKEYTKTFLNKHNKFLENDNILFSFSARSIQKRLKIVCDYLDYTNITIYSFKNFHCKKDNALSLMGLLNEEKQTNNTNISGVYSIRCKKNGRIYIGESKNIEARWCQHKLDLRYQRHCNKLLQQDYNKYGYDGFVWSVLGEYKKEKERKAAELNYIHALGSAEHGYNIVG